MILCSIIGKRDFFLEVIVINIIIVIHRLFEFILILLSNESSEIILVAFPFVLHNTYRYIIFIQSIEHKF